MADAALAHGADAAADALTAAGLPVRPATPRDAVDGVVPAWVARPADTAGVAAALRTAAAHGLAVVARGTGTKLSWGRPPARVDLLVDTTGLDRVLDHAAGDLVVETQAGVRIDDLQRTLAGSGQRLGVDPLVGPGAAGAGTVGGVVATGVSGPLRLSHGAVRDLLIGVTVVRADGVVAKAGGRVVKNVAGYDLAKLVTGSWGTLGVITEAVFRLHPVPPVARWVVSGPADGATIVAAAQAVVHSQAVPTAVEVDVNPAGAATAAVLVEGTAAGVEARTAAVRDLLGGGAVVDAAPAWWGRPVWDAGGTALRLTTSLSGLPTLLATVAAAGREHGLATSVRGSAGVGLVHAALDPAADPDAVAAVVAALRDRATDWAGDVVVLDAPSAVGERVDAWGPVRGLDLMRRVKDRFDPDHRLAPGRFAGGI